MTRRAEAARPRREEPFKDDRQFVTALSRGLDILGCFGGSATDLNGTELAAMTGLPQPTVWRLCQTMLKMGYLVPVNGDRMRPGLPVLRLGRAALASIRIVESARQPMQVMADRHGSAIGLGARDGDRVVFVQRCLAEAEPLMNFRVGARVPFATSAIGWALLAGSPADEREALIIELAAPDPHWNRAERAFREAMAEYDERGYVSNVGFDEDHNTAAVPVKDASGRPAFALSCDGPANTHTRAFLRREIAPELIRLGKGLERELRSDRVRAAG